MIGYRRMRQSGEAELRLVVAIFRWAEDRWRQIHYHGSIDDPDMLARYQQAVLKIVA
jgi:hypothetical protein